MTERTGEVEGLLERLEEAALEESVVRPASDSREEYTQCLECGVLWEEAHEPDCVTGVLLEAAAEIRRLRSELEDYRNGVINLDRQWQEQVERAIEAEAELANVKEERMHAVYSLEAMLERRDAALREARAGLDVVPFLYSVIKSGEGVTEQVTDAVLKARDARAKVDRPLALMAEQTEDWSDDLLAENPPTWGDVVGAVLAQHPPKRARQITDWVWQQVRALAPVADRAGGEETRYCSCQWVHPMDGTIWQEWPSEVDHRCPIHGTGDGEHDRSYRPMTEAELTGATTEDQTGGESENG